MDLEALQAHVERCKEPQKFFFVLQQSGRVLGSFLTARVVTTLVAVLLTVSLIHAW
jgi:ABC-type hemin transport system substrate-binding protein